MSVAEVNGQRISFQDSNGDGPPILFSHGLLMDGSMFDAQVAGLSDQFRGITWDERAHGATQAAGSFSYWDSTADALALLDHLGIERAVFAGMSQGGFVAMRAALIAPERVRGLVLIDTQAGLEDPDTLPLYQAMHDEWIANGPANVQEAVASIIFGPGIDPDAWYGKWAAQDRTQFSLAFAALVERDELVDRLGEIAIPTLIVHGSEDAAIPLWRAEQLRDGIAGPTDLVVVEGAGHASNMANPDLVNQAIASFVSALPT
jgi:pimeloyl-ACP methyl ester carboxylesterase